jgi:hypothetical protein
MTELQLRDQTKLWLTAVSAELRNALQQEVEGLRSSIDQRVAALESVISRNDELFDRLTLDIHNLAAEEARAVATHAREEAQAAAQSELSSVRAHLQSDLETARAESAALRTALETHLAETERDITAIRCKRDEHAASLEQAGRRIEALEEANAQGARIRQVADARLEEEVQRRTVVTKQLDAARQEILLAKAEADSCRLEAHLAGERMSALENRLLQLEAAAQTRTTAPLNGNSHAVLGRIKKGLDDLGTAKPEEILSTLLEHLSESFTAVALFAVEARGLRLWKGRGSDSAAAIPTQVSLEGESPLARAFRHRTMVSVGTASNDRSAEEKESSSGHAVALPVLAHGRVIAVAYAENPPGHPHDDDHVRVVEMTAQILVGCVNQRLKGNQPSAEPQDSADPQPAAEPQRSLEQANTPTVAIESAQYAISRQARRVKINTAIEVLVDGVASTLVDLSALGAQIVSPTALRPNRCVRMVLPNGSSPLNCQGRIVWAQLESPRAESPFVCRAGVRFVDVNPQGITTFISHYSPAETSIIRPV